MQGCSAYQLPINCTVNHQHPTAFPKLAMILQVGVTKKTKKQRRLLCVRKLIVDLLGVYSAEILTK